MTIVEEYIDYYDNYKKKFPHSKLIVLMEIGTFYEMYSTNEKGPNLDEICYILKIFKTRRDKKSALLNPEVTFKNPYMAGFTKCSFSKYLQKLIEENYTVVQIDQVTLPPNPKRDVVAIHSSSTCMLEQNINCPELLVIICHEIKNQHIYGLARIDLSTGKGSVLEVNSEENLICWLQKRTPKEVLIIGTTRNIVHNISNYNIIKYITKHCYLLNEFENHNNPNYHNHIFKSIYKNIGPLSPIESLNLEKYPIASQAWVHIIEFVKEHNESLLIKLKQPLIELPQQNMLLDRTALLDLKVISLDKNDHTLFSIINKCVTSIGRRLLRERLVNPTKNILELQEHYNNIENVYNCIDNIKDKLKGILDLERLHRCWETSMITPANFAKLIICYEKISLLFSIKECDNLLNKIKNPITNIIKDVKSIFKLDKMINIVNWSDVYCSFICENINSNILSISKTIDDNNIKIKNLKDEIEKDVNAKIIQHVSDRDGLYFKTTLKRSQLIKDNKWKKSKIGKNCRIYNDELISLGSKAIVNEFKLRKMLKKVFLEQIELLFEKYEENIHEIANQIAILDVSQSNAYCAKVFKYTRPIFSKDKKSKINLESVRNPIVETVQLTEKFICNDINLGQDENPNGIVLFAPNAAGKSTLLSSIGLSIIMAQSGCFVPASKLEFIPQDGIFTRINAKDSVGISSFVSEMQQLKNIIHRVTPNSLVLSDEACNMTEQTSALSISAATLIYLIEKKASFIFATHLHGLYEIKDVSELQPRLLFKNLSVELKDDDLIYSRKLQDGVGEKLYGVKVAKHILAHDKFWEIANKIKKDIVNDVIPSKSKYNSSVFKGKCEICLNNAEDVHHIDFQCNADKDGYHEHHHKNVAHNLVNLCKKCHNSVHKDKIIIEGWKQTSKGRQLMYTKITKKKFTEKEMNFIKTSDKKLSRRELSNIFKEKFNKNISLSSITKIRNSM